MKTKKIALFDIESNNQNIQCIKLLKNDKITFLGTDAHRSGSIYTKIDEIVNRIEKTVGTEKVEDMEKMFENCNKE